MGRTAVRRWLVTPIAGCERVAAADVLFATALSGFAVASASGLEGSNVHNVNAGLPAALAVLMMTAPVLLARRWPIPVSAALAVGAALNWLLIGHLVRCGAGLLAVFYTALILGTRCRLRLAVAGLALLSVSIACQGFSDPKLGPSVIVYMIPVAAAFTATGWLLGSRNNIVSQLRTSTVQLRAQRDENARLAVANEQARIAGDLDGFLAERVDRIGDTAASGRAALDSSPELARDAFESISRSGRSALTRMRDVVADLEDVDADPAGLDPTPVLAHLDRLLADGAEGSAQLRVIGDPRLLPPGMELSAYRIVERLLEATDGDAAPGRSGGNIEVVVEFRPHELQLTVTGPTARRPDVRIALAAASERAALHGGRIQTSTIDRQRTTVVALPLVIGYA
jgi:signal transduction histidine kinase